MSKTLCQILVSVLILVIAARAEKQDEGEYLVVPEGGAPWHHEKTTLSLPQKLGQLKMAGGFVYKETSWGTRVRFENDDLHAHADVFVYSCRAPCTTPEKREQEATSEISEVVGGLKQMESRGRYGNVKWDNALGRKITLGDETSTFFIIVPARYEIYESEGKGGEATKVNSTSGVLIYRDHFVKVRYTFPADHEKEGAAVCDAFLDAVLRCVLDSSWRETINKLLATYRKDPFSEKGRDAAGGIVAFADKSPLVSIRIGRGLMDFAEKCGPYHKDANMDVFRAFIAGATDAALQDGSDSAVVEGAIAEVKKICARFNQENPKLQMPSISDFATEVKKENEKETARSGKVDE